MSRYGTPEWMAPEVIEGHPYSSKIDVYSFGILLCEMLTRKMPYRDQYDINCYDDVFDAVLDDGAVPTIPVWADYFLKDLIIQCVSRDPTARLTFADIIIVLTKISDLPAEAYYFAFDIPRIQDMLEGDIETDQALAAGELAFLLESGKIFRVSNDKLDPHMKVLRKLALQCTGDWSEFLSEYQKSSHDHIVNDNQKRMPLHDTVALEFLDSMCELLWSGKERVQEQACRAIAALLKNNIDVKSQDMDRECLVKRQVITPLFNLLVSKSEKVR